MARRYRPLDMPYSEHRKIRTSKGVQAAIKAIAADAAKRAGEIAGDPTGYGIDHTVGSDRARAHVWAKSGPAKRAEAKSAPLMQIAAESAPR